MTRRLIVALIAFAGFGVLASAATQTQTGRQATTPPMVAVIGCVAPVLPATPAGTGDKPAPPPAAFRLTETQPGGGSPVVGSTGGARPATPPAPQRGTTPATIETEYWLAAVPSIDLKAHANHRVEVTGTVSAVKPAVPPPPAPAGAKVAPPPKTLLTITELKMVSSECK